jgi:hypothetical protein
MDASRPTRSCSRNRPTEASDTPRASRQICIPMPRDLYDRIWHTSAEVRQYLEELIEAMPELFPQGISDGFHLTGRLPESKKLPGIQLRQLRLKDGRVFTLRPSFVMPYMSGTVEELDKPLMLLAHGTPVWLVTYVCGRNDMYWQRQLERLGRNSLVGTTVRNPQRLPEHLAADELHTDWCGAKGYVPITAGGGCVLGIGLSESADEAHLTEVYGVFQKEVLDVCPEYNPVSVCTDGWKATQNAFRALFWLITVVLCYLHGFLKIRDCCRKARELHSQIWHVYRAATADEFRSRMATFRAWCQERTWPQTVSEALAKLWNHESDYVVSYSHPGCHRTSNLVDRLMNRFTRLLYAGRGLHGHQTSSELRLRGLALLQNFRPFAPRSGQPCVYQSPAHRLNQKRYHDHWLHNLQISASLGGFRACT